MRPLWVTSLKWKAYTVSAYTDLKAYKLKYLLLYSCFNFDYTSEQNKGIFFFKILKMMFSLFWYMNAAGVNLSMYLPV